MRIGVKLRSLKLINGGLGLNKVRELGGLKKIEKLISVLSYITHPRVFKWRVYTICPFQTDGSNPHKLHFKIFKGTRSIL